MKFERFDMPYATFEDWAALCPEEQYRVVDPSVLPAGLPSTLLAKFNSVVLMSSGSPAATVFVANGLRVDAAASAVDEEPYIIAFEHATSSASGGFIHHGDWPGRTSYARPEFFTAIAASGMAAHYPIAERPTAASGLLANLPRGSHSEAFWRSLRLLREATGSED
jgi:hypothetical protein